MRVLSLPGSGETWQGPSISQNVPGSGSTDLLSFPDAALQPRAPRAAQAGGALTLGPRPHPPSRVRLDPASSSWFCNVCRGSTLRMDTQGPWRSRSRGQGPGHPGGGGRGDSSARGGAVGVSKPGTSRWTLPLSRPPPGGHSCHLCLWSTPRAPFLTGDAVTSPAHVSLSVTGRQRAESQHPHGDRELLLPRKGLRTLRASEPWLQTREDASLDGGAGRAPGPPTTLPPERAGQKPPLPQTQLVTGDQRPGPGAAEHTSASVPGGP